MKKAPHILVIGSINMDLVLQVASVPVTGETVLGDAYWNSAGGKGANQAAACARLGASVSFAGKVGNDKNGRALLDMLKGIGVNTALIKTDPTAPSGLAVVMVEPNGDNRILVFPGSNLQLMPEDVETIIQQGTYDALIVQFEIPQETAIAACRTAIRQKMAVIVDAGPAKYIPLEWIAGVTVLSPNETETAALCGVYPNSEETACQAAKLLMEKAEAKYIIIKRGENGAYVYGNGISRNFNAPRVKSVDSTAAGDAFTAALAIRLTVNGDIAEAVRYANYVGALTVTKTGAQTSLPTSEEVEDFIRMHDIV